jgi:thiamine pyrophosphate-dependent acetolactate synthase large subunit-like protein
LAARTPARTTRRQSVITSAPSTGSWEGASWRRLNRAGIERAARLIARAKRPLLLVDGVIHLSKAWDALTRLAEAQSIPVAHTMSGKGGIACAHALNVGLFGRYSRIANDLIEASDGLIVVVCKLGEIVTKRFALPPAHVPVIHRPQTAGARIKQGATPAAAQVVRRVTMVDIDVFS